MFKWKKPVLMVDQYFSESHMEFVKAAAAGESLLMCKGTCELVWIPGGS